MDSSGRAYVTGNTNSTSFPTTSGAYDEDHNGGTYDAFVAKINPAGSGDSDLVYSTFLGGGSIDRGYDIAVDGSGNAYVTGEANSSNFPTTTGAYDEDWNSGADAYVTKINPAGSGASDLVYSTFLGGSADDYGQGIAVDSLGRAYVTGYTGSTGFPTTSGAYDEDHNSGDDVFVTKLDMEPCTYSLSPTSVSPAASSTTGSVTVTAVGSCTWTAVSNDSWITVTSGSSGSGNGTVGYSVAANTSSNSRSGTVTIAGETCTINQAVVTGKWIVTGDLDGNGMDDLVVVLRGGVWAWMNNSGWRRITTARPVEDTMATGDLDGNGRDDLVVVLRGGVWARMNNNSWRRISSTRTVADKGMATGDLDGSGKDELVGVWGSGVWARMNNSSWRRLTTAIPMEPGTATGDLDGQ